MTSLGTHQYEDLSTAGMTNHRVLTRLGELVVATHDFAVEYSLSVNLVSSAEIVVLCLKVSGDDGTHFDWWSPAYCNETPGVVWLTTNHPTNDVRFEFSDPDFFSRVCRGIGTFYERFAEVQSVLPEGEG